MFGKVWRSVVLPVLVLTFLWGPFLGGASAAEQPVRFKYGRVVETSADAASGCMARPLGGRITYSDGKTGVADAVVRVWNIEGRKFARMVTADKDGVYTLGDLPEGWYLLVFGDRVTVELLVSKNVPRPQEHLDVVIPHGQSAFAQMTRQRQAALLALMGVAQAEEGDDGGEDDDDDRGGLLTTLVMGAGGAAMAVGCVSIVDEMIGPHTDGDEKRVCSP